MRKSGKIYRQTAIVLLLCSITASLHRRPVAMAVMPVSAANTPVIGRIVSRHYTVTVASGPDAPLYTVTDDRGKRLINHSTLAAIKQTDPDLFGRISSALAMGDMDASIDTDFTGN